MQSDIRKRPKPNPNAGQTFAVFHKADSTLADLRWPLDLHSVFRPNVQLLLLLGPCWFLYGETPVYRPWMLLAWAYKFASWKPVHEYLYEASIWFGVFSALAVVLYLVLSFLRGGYPRTTTSTARPGGRQSPIFVVTAFFSQRASSAARRPGRLSANARTGTTKYRLNRTSRIIGHVGETSTLMVAPSRSGKGVSTVIPTLLSWGGSVIVFDPKGRKLAHHRGVSPQVLPHPSIQPCHQGLRPLQHPRRGAPWRERRARCRDHRGHPHRSPG